jgi:hypothetical protein
LHAKKKAKAEPEQPKIPGFDCPVCKIHIENYKKLIEHVKTHVNDDTETTVTEPSKDLLTPKYELVEFLQN